MSATLPLDQVWLKWNYPKWKTNHVFCKGVTAKTCIQRSAENNIKLMYVPAISQNLFTKLYSNMEEWKKSHGRYNVWELLRRKRVFGRDNITAMTIFVVRTILKILKAWRGQVELGLAVGKAALQKGAVVREDKQNPWTRWLHPQPFLFHLTRGECYNSKVKNFMVGLHG